jgi:hypothetical protein
MAILYSLTLWKIIFASFSAFRIPVHLLLGTHWLLPHQSSSITFTGYQFIIALTSKSLVLRSKSTPSTDLLISLPSSSLTSYLNRCAAQATISFISPELTVTGCRAFSSSAPKVWNSLTISIHSFSISFKHQLIIFYFCAAFP